MYMDFLFVENANASVVRITRRIKEIAGNCSRKKIYVQFW